MLRGSAARALLCVSAILPFVALAVSNPGQAASVGPAALVQNQAMSQAQLQAQARAQATLSLQAALLAGVTSEAHLQNLFTQMVDTTKIGPLNAFIQVLGELEAFTGSQLKAATEAQQEHRELCHSEGDRLQTLIEQLTNKATSLNGQITSFENSILADKSQIDARNTRISELNEQLDNVNHQIASGDDARNQAHEDFEDKLADVKDAIEAIKEIIVIINKDLLGNKESAMQLTQRAHVRATKAGHTNAAVMIALLKAHIEEHEEGGNADLLLLLAQRIETFLGMYQMELVAAEQTQAQAWQEQRDTLLQSAENLNQAVSNEKNAIGQLTDHISQLSNQLTQAQSDLTNTQNELTDAQKQLAALQKSCEQQAQSDQATIDGFNSQLDAIARIRQLVKDKIKKQHIEDRLAKENALEWVVGDWSECDAKCGGGYRKRTVTCPAKEHTEFCEAEIPDMVEKCNNQPCAVDCKVSDWTASGQCSRTCGTGSLLYTRKVLVKPEFGGKECPDLSRYESCNTQDCQWAYGTWGACSAQCGTGSQSRTATCPEQGLCASDADTTRQCDAGACPTWQTGQWSACTKGDNGCVQTRDVTCSRQGLCVGDKPAGQQSCPCPVSGGACEGNANWMKAPICGGSYGMWLQTATDPQGNLNNQLTADLQAGKMPVSKYYYSSYPCFKSSYGSYSPGQIYLSKTTVHMSNQWSYIWFYDVAGGQGSCSASGCVTQAYTDDYYYAATEGGCRSLA